MRPQRGFSFLLVLFLVAITAAGLSVFGEVWSTARQREREAELLFAGAAIRQAIASYHSGTAGAARQYPAKLDDLLKDPRFPDTRRHLRQLYREPFSEKGEWVLIMAPTGGIMGVASPSERAPLKRRGFQVQDVLFEAQSLQLKDKLRYRDWEFVHGPLLNFAPMPRVPMPSR